MSECTTNLKGDLVEAIDTDDDDNNKNDCLNEFNVIAVDLVDDNNDDMLFVAILASA